MVSNFLHISSQFFVILHKYHLFILEEIADKFTRLFNLLDYTYNINFPFSRTKTNKNIMLLGHWVSHTDPGWSALRWKLRPSSPSAGSAPRCAVNKLLNLESWILNLHSAGSAPRCAVNKLLNLESWILNLHPLQGLHLGVLSINFWILNLES